MLYRVTWHHTSPLSATLDNQEPITTSKGKKFLHRMYLVNCTPIFLLKWMTLYYIILKFVQIEVYEHLPPDLFTVAQPPAQSEAIESIPIPYPVPSLHLTPVSRSIHLQETCLKFYLSTRMLLFIIIGIRLEQVNSRLVLRSHWDLGTWKSVRLRRRDKANSSDTGGSIC